MPVTYKVPLNSMEQTIKGMYALVRKYNSDLDIIYIKTPSGMFPILKMSPIEFFNYVRDIPYRRDKSSNEVIGRPLRLVKLPSLDCKKKAVLIASYCAALKIPYRFVISSTRADGTYHHIYPEVYTGNQWVSFDATYSRYGIGMKKRETAREAV